ncbi:hypothetical protein EPH95_05405 [Salicibibacter halophilus]|uniref:Uncharacterized protein n=1 Tax=Salicibibacter halophilus TaxID=2502791 RepID=A0A514LFQ7_9BACI|nr:hypothetical protein EPH95_05405 [Salicibibacter halophilus]
MKNGRDTGFVYWKLNYRSKFRRTLWHVPFAIILSILIFTFFGLTTINIVVVITMLSLLIAQLLYTYLKWKSERKTHLDQ